MSQTTTTTGEKKLIQTECPICLETDQMSVDKECYEKWKGGELVQNAFPGTSAEFRETLITGMCMACQDQIFGDPSDMLGGRK